MTSAYIGHSHIYYIGKVVNDNTTEIYGIPGLKLKELNTNAFAGRNFEHIHLHIGDNDVHEGAQLEVIAVAILEAADQFASSAVVITIGSLIPRSKDTRFGKADFYNSAIKSINDYLEKNISESRPWAAFLKYPVRITNQTTADGIHLTEESYKKAHHFIKNEAWRKYLELRDH